MKTSSLQIKPSQLSEVLKVMVPAGLPILVKGAPGVGKSDIISQSVQSLGYDIIIEHPAVSDPTDYKGMPYVGNGHAEFLPFGSLRKIINATKPTVYVMDDVGQAANSVQAALMQLILARRVNGNRVADCVTFLAATNRHSDRAGVSGLLEPVKSRFAAIFELITDLEDWTKWALQANLPAELIAFIRFRPNFLHNFTPTNEIKNSPCPRTIANAGKLMAAGIPPSIEYQTFAGAAGEEFAAEFCGFLKIFRTLPNPDLVIASPLTAEVPSDPATLYALCGALSRRVKKENIDNLVAYADRLPEEFSIMLITDSANSNKEIIETSAYITWCSKHSTYMI